MTEPAASSSGPAPPTACSLSIPPASAHVSTPSSAPISGVAAFPASSSVCIDTLNNLERSSGAHPLTLAATKVGVFDINPSREGKSFLNVQLKVDPWQPFCIWHSQQQGLASTPLAPESTAFFVSVGQADGTVSTSKICMEQSVEGVAPTSQASTSVLLSSSHRVASVVAAPSHPLLAAICDGCLFILSTDPSRFNSIGPTVIARVKKCRPVIAFDDQCLYYLMDGKDKVNCLPLARLLDKTSSLLPEPDGRIGRLFDVTPITMSIACSFHDTITQLHQLDITALSSSCCVLAISHMKGFVVVDLKRSHSNVIHSANHDGSVRSMISIMPGGIIAIANHPLYVSPDDTRKIKKDDDRSFENCIVFLQPPRSNVMFQSPDELLRSHQIYCARYSSTGCTIKGMASVGSFMFVLLELKDSASFSAAPVAPDHVARSDSGARLASASQSGFLDICVPTSGISLNHHKFHSARKSAKRLQELTFSMPCFHDFKLKWAVSAGSKLACIGGSTCADIALIDINPLFFQSIIDAQWFQETKNQALPQLNVSNGSCEWDQLDNLVPSLNGHWWKTLCFDVRSPQKFVQNRLEHLRAMPSLKFSNSDTPFSSETCFRTVTRNVWELVIRKDDANEISRQHAMIIDSIPEAGSDDSYVTTPPQNFNPWSELVTECSRITSKHVDENRSEFEKLDIAFGRSAPSLKRGAVIPAHDDDQVQKARDIMSAGMNKKDKMSLAMTDLAAGPCARLFQMHICLRSISLSRTIGVDLLPLTLSCCLYAPNGRRLTPNHEVDRRPNDLSPFNGSCIFANITGGDAKNQLPPRFVIAVFRFYCHYRGDKSSPGKKYLEKEVVTEIKAEQQNVFRELTNLGHLLQPMAWSYVVIPLDTNELKEFVWPEWVNPDERVFFTSEVTSKGMHHSDAHWLFETERGFCAPVYRLNNKAFTDHDVRDMVQNIPPRRERLTQSIFLSFTAQKGHLALPRISSALPPTAIIYALPEDYSHQSVFLEGVLSNVRETPLSCYRPCFDERHELFLLPQMLVSSGLKKAHNLLLEIMVPSITRAFPRYFECIRCDVAIQVRSTDAKLEQDESVLLTDLDDHQKEQMGFLKCINSIRRLRDPPNLFDAEKYSATAAQHAASANAGGTHGRTSELTYSDLSPLIYHETECNLSSQIHILLPFIPPSEAMKLHVLFNVYHVSCWNTKKKQASKGTLQLIGRGFHPLLSFAPQNSGPNVSDLHEGLKIPLAMKLDPGYLDNLQKGPEGFFHREVNACVQLSCIWRSNIWPASPGIQLFAWQSARIMSILRSAERKQAGPSSKIDHSSSTDNQDEDAQCSEHAIDKELDSTASTSVCADAEDSVVAPAISPTYELPPFVEGTPLFQALPGLLNDNDGQSINKRLHVAVVLACELPMQSPFVLLKFLPVWSQALFDLLPLVNIHQSKALFEAFVSCIDSIKHASDLNHDFIQSVLSDWVTWSVSISYQHLDGNDPLYIVLLREFVRLLRPWLGLSSASSYNSFHHSHSASLSVADVILSLISKLAASSQPTGIEQAWGHISRLASSLGALIASGEMHAAVQSPHGDSPKDPREQPLRELPSYLNVCSAFAEFLRGWFSLGQRGATAQACFAFCHELYRHHSCENLVVYFWKRFCSDASDTPFLFPPAYPDVPFPLFHVAGPLARTAQSSSVASCHSGKAGVENTPILSVAFNLCSSMLLRGSPNGTSLGLCIVNQIIAASCEFTHSSTASVVRSSASSLLERLLLVSAPFISKNQSSSKPSPVVINFFSLVSRTLTCVSEADWEQFWLQEIDKNNMSLSCSFPDDLRRPSCTDHSGDKQKQPTPMSLFGWLKAMMIVAFKGNPGLDSETGVKSSVVDPTASNNAPSAFLNYSGNLDDDVKFSIAVSICNGLHVLLAHLKTEAFLQRLQISERKTHFFDLQLRDDSAKITGITTDQSSAKVLTLFEGAWSLLLHLHFVLVCSQNSFEYKSHLFELRSHINPTPDPVFRDAEARRNTVTSKSFEAAATLKNILEKQYNKPLGDRSSRANAHMKLDDSAVTKNVYIAIHDSMKLLLEQSVHCLFSSSMHSVLSCRYRNRVILQIFLEGTNMNQYDPSDFSSTISAAPSRPMSVPSDLASVSRSNSAALPAAVSFEFFVSDETKSQSNLSASDLSQGSDAPDASSLSSSIVSSSSEPPAPNQTLLNRVVSQPARLDALFPLRANMRSMRASTLWSLDALRDQGNIKFLSDFLLMFIREDFKLNASNLFASSFAFTSAVHDMYTVLTVSPNFRQSAAATASIILKVTTSELTLLNSAPASRVGSVFEGCDDKFMQELSSAAPSMFSVIESIAMDAKVVWDSSLDSGLADATYRMFLLTQRSAPSPYRRAFWLEKLAEMHRKNDRPLETAINLLELCVHANITAASSGGKLPVPLLGDDLVFPFVNFEALSRAFICPADGPVGRNAFLAAKDHKELFAQEHILQHLNNAAESLIAARQWHAAHMVYTLLMKHFLVTRNSEKLSLVFAGFKNVYDQQMLKPAYPMAFFYVKVHNPFAVELSSSSDEPDQEFVYIDDGFVTIGAFLAKIKSDFQKVVHGEVKVVQGESVPSSMTSQFVLCIHNLTPVEKVDPTWTAPAHTEFYYEQPYVEGGGAQTSDMLKQRLRRYVLQPINIKRDGAVLRVFIVGQHFSFDFTPQATSISLLSPATKQYLGLRTQIEAIRISVAEADIKNPDIFKKLMGTLIPGACEAPGCSSIARRGDCSADQCVGVNEGPRAVVLAFFKDVPRENRSDDLNELSVALRDLCCECRSTVALFQRHAAVVPKEVQKSLDDMGYGEKLQSALELLEADVKCWC